ncbi:hypothetical protein OH809_44435 (plasmid) [Streptomyces sp. NBC_00873]|uniref:hypothetical protein n=1 Tax=unclassified Streptomyces TaxID=2593676 RepID=UPI002F91913F|nr:hypothetical protein OH809_44435 [Streptomyces sp. NBC_00873]WTA49289.1 hypothetical protein OH821_44205 [Streptomyces sp. NBC_00842]
MTLHDPVRAADDLWKRLIEHQPGMAAALAMQVRELPSDWPLRVLGVGRPEAALALTSSSSEQRVEVEPYDADMEDCSACLEAEYDPCRYHAGVSVGYQMLGQSLLDAVKLDKDVTVRVVLQRLADDEETR